VDFVLTFEELQGMFEAKEINFETIEPMYDLNEGSAAGRGFAVSGGVAGAVENMIRKENPDAEVKTARAEGLRDCRKLMAMAKAGKYNGYLLEGMACPGGCIAGAGTLLPVDLAAKVVGRYQTEADVEDPTQSAYRDHGKSLEE
jgi:iron only hydrogenase large subunit-like protein